MKWLGILVIIAVVLGAGYFVAGPDVVHNNDMKKHTENHNHNHQDPTALLNRNKSAQPAANSKQSSNNVIPAGKTGNPHFDQLSPEMQQALKDSLLLEGPMETITHPDGSIELPSNGRFTQMPVAVEMPDGSIQIREYSEIPKTR